jgi:polysaccharide biosynthesis protein PslG
MRLILALALALVLAPPASANWPFELGIGEQQPQMFDDPRFVALELEHVRFVTAYDVACRPGADRASLDAWLAGARRTGSRPLVAFSFSSREGARWKLPSYRTFLRCFKAFRSRYPRVRDFNPWNEANHSSQPTYRHPKKAAGFYNAMRRACPSCRIAAGDLLDWSNLERWFQRYRPHLRGQPRLWSMHNYLDVNRPRSWRRSGTRKLLGMTRGELWITETAGVVVSRRYSRYDEQRAARATRRMFGFASHSPRISRLYSYQWQAGCDPYGWDSAWFRSNGSARPAWRVVVEEVARELRLSTAAVEALDPPLTSAMHDTCEGSPLPAAVE